MTAREEHLVEKVASHLADLVEIYAEVYLAIKETDPAELPESVLSELPRFDAPEIIEPSKAAAILKAMLGSTSSDKFILEDCYSVKMPNGQSVSSFVGEQLRELGIGYHDFYPYLRHRGWLSGYQTYVLPDPAKMEAL
jgi:hypothetical protein